MRIDRMENVPSYEPTLVGHQVVYFRTAVLVVVIDIEAEEHWLGE